MFDKININNKGYILYCIVEYEFVKKYFKLL